MENNNEKTGILKKIWKGIVAIFCVLFVIKAILGILGINPDF